MRYDALIIGGGPAGMAAAIAARERGLNNVAIIEREAYIGGVLPQCVHDGFGLHLLKKSYTGPEYAGIWQKRVRSCGIQVFLQTSVLSITKASDGGYVLDVAGAALGGHAQLQTCSVVVATGCRERTRGQLAIPGTRPAGVITAGTAQYMINVKNQLPGDNVVILGSGDIGLIMARRMTLEGATVKMVLGLEASGLLRNHISCVRDFDIPFRYGWGVLSIAGHGQLQGVNIAPLQEDGSFDHSRRLYVRCNVLLIACGLIPEREVLADLTETEPGIYLTGNAKQPVDLVDQVTKEGIITGKACAEYVIKHFKTGHVLQFPEDLAAISALSIEEPKGSVADIFNGNENALEEDDSNFIVCTLCPTGCVIEHEKGGSVSGNACERGKRFARSEVKKPMRTFTGTVMTTEGNLLPVKTKKPVPKELLPVIAKLCTKIKAPHTTKTGDVVSSQIVGTQVNLVATSDASQEEVA